MEASPGLVNRVRAGNVPRTCRASSLEGRPAPLPWWAAGPFCTRHAMATPNDYPRDLAGYGRNAARSALAGRRPRGAAIRAELRGGRRERDPARRCRVGGFPVRRARRAAVARAAPHERGIHVRIRLARRLLAAVAAVHRAQYSGHGLSASPPRSPAIPEIVAAMREAGWEIASHGLKWIDYKDFSREDEAAHMRETIRLHTEATGERPFGWYTGRTSVQHALARARRGRLSLFVQFLRRRSALLGARRERQAASDHSLHARRQRHALHQSAGF